MAHYAKLGANNKVIAVHVVADSDCQNADGIEDEEVGRQFLERIHSWPLWKKTSYNTQGGQHKSGGTPFRGNYAGIGMTYDEDNDIFIGKKPYASWILNTSTASWNAPITYPSVTDDGADPVVWTYRISWNDTKYQADNTKGWEAIKSNDESETPTKYDWNGTAWVSE